MVSWQVSRYSTEAVMALKTSIEENGSACASRNELA